MPQNHSRMKLRISKLILPFILFAFYRQTESWFYEPLGNYYHFSAAKMPEVHYLIYFWDIASKFLINTLISLLCIDLFYGNQFYNKLARYTFLMIGIVVIPIYFYQVYEAFPFGKMFGYYTRRVLIHPIVLLVLLASFYFDSKKNKYL